jgi:acyl dehydratase
MVPRLQLTKSGEGLVAEAESKPFDPAQHRFGPVHWFEDLVVGQSFYINSRTQTEALFAAFQLASGDNHPIHYDREYCRAQGHRDLLAHGLQVAIQGAAGAGIFPHFIGESLIGFLEQSSRFRKPVYVGDTLYPMLVVSELKPGRTSGVVTMTLTIHNQKSELVCDGMHKYLIKRRPA